MHREHEAAVGGVVAVLRPGLGRAVHPRAVAGRIRRGAQAWTQFSTAVADVVVVGPVAASDAAEALRVAMYDWEKVGMDWFAAALREGHGRLDEHDERFKQAAKAKRVPERAFQQAARAALGTPPVNGVVQCELLWAGVSGPRPVGLVWRARGVDRAGVGKVATPPPRSRRRYRRSRALPGHPRHQDRLRARRRRSRAVSPSLRVISRPLSTECSASSPGAWSAGRVSTRARARHVHRAFAPGFPRRSRSRGQGLLR